MTIGAIILCGGKSRRMTLPKATLPFGEEVLLQRVIRICQEVLTPVVVVAAEQQELPALASDVIVVRDEQPDSGPLEGIATGLKAIQSHATAAYTTSCDVPFLLPAFVNALTERLKNHDIVVPFDDNYHHPLAAVYHTRVLAPIRELLSQDRRRPVFLFDRVDTIRVPTEDLKSVDPELASLTNLNQPEDYLAAVDRAGFNVPADLRDQLQRSIASRANRS